MTSQTWFNLPLKCVNTNPLLPILNTKKMKTYQCLEKWIMARKTPSTESYMLGVGDYLSYLSAVELIYQ